MARRLAAVASAVLLGAVVVFQTALVLGAPWGEYTHGGGASGTLPAAGRVMALISVAILITFALTMLARVGWGPLARAPRRVVSVLAWVAVGYSVLAVLLNAATPSANERRIWLPVSVLLVVTQLTTVLATRHRSGD